MGPNARAMAAVPRYSNFILRARTCHLSSCCDVTYQLSITRSRKVLNWTDQLLARPKDFASASTKALPKRFPTQTAVSTCWFRCSNHVFSAPRDRCFGDGACLEARRTSCFGQLDAIWLWREDECGCRPIPLLIRRNRGSLQSLSYSFIRHRNEGPVPDVE
jgi:hypothetical protein